MPKKPARNAFYFFMKDIEPQLRREGRVFPHGMQDVVPIAHPRWKNLPEAEKDRYEKIAKEYKAKMRGAEGDKYRQDNQCKLLSERRDEAADLQRKRTKERNSVKSHWPTGKLLADEKFYIINIQTLCKTDDGDYLPCEIGAIEYSLRAGITKTLHRFIEPGRIPTGYRYECKAKSEDYHQIPIERFEMADPNYRGLWIQLENFVNPNGEKPEYPPFYCMGVDVDEIEYCLGWVHDKACLGYANRLKKVYCLEGLVQDLFAHNGQSVSETQVIDMLTAHTWDFEPKTRCDFHEELECKYCSLGIVNRYVYAISDSVCPLYGVQITSKHLPICDESSVFNKNPFLPRILILLSRLRQMSRKARHRYAISDSVCPLYGVQITSKHLPIRDESSVSCVVLPPSSMRIDPNQDARMPSTRKNVPINKPPSHQPQTFQSNQPPRYGGAPPGVNDSDDDDDDSEDDDDDDVGYTSLRRPHNPGYSGMTAGPSAGGRGAPSAAPWSGVPIRQPGPPIITDQSNFPSLGGQPSFPPPGLSGIGRGNALAGIGRGAPVAQIVNPEEKKFAGRAMAPEPTFAPPPPAAWQADIKEPQKISMADISRAFQQTSIKTEKNGVNLSELQDKMVSMQQQQYNGNTPSFPTPTNQPTRGVQGPRGGMMGQFRGILGNLQKGKRLPVGRGYAPPGAGDVSQMVGQIN